MTIATIKVHPDTLRQILKVYDALKAVDTDIYLGYYVTEVKFGWEGEETGMSIAYDDEHESLMLLVRGDVVDD